MLLWMMQDTTESPHINVTKKMLSAKNAGRTPKSVAEAEVIASNENMKPISSILSISDLLSSRSAFMLVLRWVKRGRFLRLICILIHR